MTKATVIFLAALLAAILASCEFTFVSGTGSGTGAPPDDGSLLNEGDFYAQNMLTGSYYVLKAMKLVEGEKCVIWAEEGSGVTQKLAQEIANEYDNVIRPVIVENFSKKNFSVINDGTEYFFDDMLDYANWKAGRNDKKLTILLLDIGDGYKVRTDPYVAGYFFSGNFWQRGKIDTSKSYSNGRDMIYIDTYPGLVAPETGAITDHKSTYTVFAHELQHMINYITGVQLGRERYMDTWIDEGLSSQAEYFYLGENPQDKCIWFSADSAGTIARGNNFFVWDNHPGQSILDEYSTVYLFFRWLYLQGNTELRSRIFHNIQTSPYADYRAVTGAAGQIDASWNSWENLLRTWFAANYYPGSLHYGYKGDLFLQAGHGSINPNYQGIKVYAIRNSSLELYPSEGVYSIINNSFTPAGTSANIRYSGLNRATGIIDTDAPYSGNVLITFNANSDKDAAAETGSLTGISSSLFPRAAEENTQTVNFTGPYILDARDILNRNNK